MLVAAEVALRPVAAVRVAELTGTAASYDPGHTGPVIQLLYPELLRRLAAAGVQPAAGPKIAYYTDPAEPSDEVTVHAAVPVTAGWHPGWHPGCDFAVVDLPAIGSAATIIHRGPMSEVIQSLLEAAGWIEDNGYCPAGSHREVYLDYDPARPGRAVTELQVPVAREPDTAPRGIRIGILR